MTALAFLPFTFSLALLMALLGLELLLMLIGGSLFGEVGDAPELDAGLDMDLDVDFDADVGIAAADAPVADAGGGLLSWLGLGHVPLMIWLASMLVSFGLGGVILQNAALALLGLALPLWVAVPIAFGGAIVFARQFGGLVARIMPKNESSAVHSTRLGQRRGVVSQGTARRGNPAEVRVNDGHSNTHYLRAEPYADEDVISEGTEVLIIRPRMGKKRGKYWLIAVSD